MAQLKTATLTVDLASLTVIQQGLLGLKISTDRTLDLINQQIAEQLAEAELEEKRAAMKLNGAAEAVQ